MQKFCNENIVYYLWFTPAEKQDKELLEQRKKDLTKELQRWEQYLNQVKKKNERIRVTQFLNKNNYI